MEQLLNFKTAKIMSYVVSAAFLLIHIVMIFPGKCLTHAFVVSRMCADSEFQELHGGWR